MTPGSAEYFFRQPRCTTPRFSGSGQMISLLRPWRETPNLFVRNRRLTGESQLTFHEEGPVINQAWLGDRAILYEHDSRRDEAPALRLYDIFTCKTRTLIEGEGIVATLIDDTSGAEGGVWFAANQRDPELFDLYRLADVEEDPLLIARNRGDFFGWILDASGDLGGALSTDGYRSCLELYEPDTDEWRPLKSFTHFDQFDPLWISRAAGTYAAITDIGREFAALVEFDIASGEQIRVFEKDQREVVGAKLDRRGMLVAVEYGGEIPSCHFLQEKIAERVSRSGELTEGVVGVVDVDGDGRRLLLKVGAPRTPPRYHLLDVDRPEELPRLRCFPWIERTHTAESFPVSIPTRDGERMSALLTFPWEYEEGGPAVVIAHGGPEDQVMWYYDPLVQYLAARGFTVLAPNFRGSTGSGRRWRNGIMGDWGGTPQTDIADAAAWIGRLGLASPDRIGIYGGSFGGYSALCGLIRYPELYACGISENGPTSLFTFFDSIPPYWEPMRRRLYEYIGHPERERERLVEQSPLEQVSRIRSPVMLLQSRNDPRVPEVHTETMAEALSSRGVEVDVHYFEGEGHSIASQRNLYHKAELIGSFLERHLCEVNRQSFKRCERRNAVA